jgi:hypothetical protein
MCYVKCCFFELVVVVPRTTVLRFFLLKEPVRELGPRTRGLGDDDYYLALTLGG